MDWYSFSPQDTLFFRGAEPANMGESHAASAVFPPPAHTIAGALRTMALVQNNIAFDDYGKGRLQGQEIIAAIGKAGEESPFSILGPFFHVEGKIWVPCPFTWYGEKDENDSNTPTRERNPMKVTTSKALNSAMIRTGSGVNLRWAKGDELETLGGRWVEIEALNSGSDEKTIKEKGFFCVTEIHTGIALDVKEKRRVVRDGHLYSFVHARLCQGVKLIFGLNKALPICNKGVLKLGAEQRFGQYEKFDGITIPQGNSGLYMSLSIQEGSEEANQSVVSTGRIQYYGGWDLHRQFHKPMKGYYPAGSVFDKRLNDNCIEL
jgi:CRISPR-associated protein Cmr3